MYGLWKVVWQECICDFMCLVTLTSGVDWIVDLGQNVRFDDLEESHVRELFVSHEEEMTAEEKKLGVKSEVERNMDDGC